MSLEETVERYKEANRSGLASPMWRLAMDASFQQAQLDKMLTVKLEESQHVRFVDGFNLVVAGAK